jgi:predicted dehydrogenase
MTDGPTAAIIGLGKMGLVHGAAVTVAGGRVVGFVDPQPKTLGNARWIGLSAPFFTSLDDLFQTQIPDAVFVSVPSNANLAVARACRTAGVRGIFLEKPLANAVESADDLVRLAGDAGIIDGVGFMLRHVPTFRLALRLLRGDAIGQVDEVQGEAFMDARLSARGNWFRQRVVSGGGALTSVGSHILSLLDPALGAVEKVESVHLTSLPGQVEDRARATLRYVSGVRATLSVGWDVAGYEAMHVGVVFEGTRGRLTADLEHVALTQSASQHVWTERQLADDAPGFVGGRGYVRQDAQFLTAVAGGQAERVTWHEGASVQHALAALYRTAEPAL